MSMRNCGKHGCGRLIPAGVHKCDEHRREADRARGSSTARGYDAEHRHERAHWIKLIASGEPVYCARKCGKRILPGDPFDLGHNDARTAWTGPECPSCNRSAGASAGNTQRGT